MGTRKLEIDASIPLQLDLSPSCSTRERYPKPFSTFEATLRTFGLKKKKRTNHTTETREDNQLMTQENKMGKKVETR
jgi:hypothetical protein